ncbi:hypothetical protein BDN70DRAFT_877909 [Pholiota conissans]|uniref:Uncharacterized protein n=1 Tax=Pholiota conissans TaxID=109636 RepID=A0A9P5Z4N6_9AGAR|nr:hypothetical protein BDN70DRAFT_877909 [Pholiota conissans]
MPDYSPTPSMDIAARPASECNTPSLLLPLSSTPFTSNAMPARFEYPFPIILQQISALPPAMSASTQALTNGSIVPPSGAGGRGTDVFSFASFSPPLRTTTLSYPSPTASASQAPDVGSQMQADDSDALPTPRMAYNHHHYTSAQLCMLASANSPMPPSLALKRRRMLLDEERKNGTDVPDTGPGAGIGVSMI